MARVLLVRLQRGPTLASVVGEGILTLKEAENQVRAWLEGWIIEDAKQLLATHLRDHGADDGQT